MKNINLKKNFQSIDDIIDIKFKNIQKEVGKIISKFLYDETCLFEIENFWTNEKLNSNNNEFNYELKENNYLAKKINKNQQIIKSKIKFTEGNIYKIVFNIIYANTLSNFEIGFGNNELCNTKISLKEKGAICLSAEGLYIDGKEIKQEKYIENDYEICFILNLKEKNKNFILFINGILVGEFNFNLIDIYALASIEGIDGSVKLKTFIKL